MRRSVLSDPLCREMWNWGQKFGNDASFSMASGPMLSNSREPMRTRSKPMLQASSMGSVKCFPMSGP